MIVLNADESMLLLIAKNWEHKDVYCFPKESKMDYIQRVCNYRCFGVKYDDNNKYKTSIYNIYCPLMEKVLTTKDILYALEYVEPTYHTYTMTKTEALISALSMVRCIADNGTVLIQFDKSLIKE